MPPVEFEPTISKGEWSQTYVLDRAATWTGKTCMLYWHYSDWSGSVNCFSIVSLFSLKISKNYRNNRHILPILVAVRSKAWVCGRSFARIAGTSPAWDMDVCLLKYCVLSGRGLTVGLITRPGKSYRL